MIIVGCSGLGKEVAWLCRRNNIHVEAFLDDNSLLHGKEFEGALVIGNLNDAVQFLSSPFIIAIANPAIRKSIATKLVTFGISEFPSLVDKDAVLGDTSFIGHGSIIFPGAIVTVSCKIGAFTVLNKNCSVGHDVTFDDYCTLAPLAMIGGHVTLGEGTDVGASACIRQGLSIGSFTRVGMGSVVVKDIGPNCTVVGNPARLINGAKNA